LLSKLIDIYNKNIQKEEDLESAIPKKKLKEEDVES